MKLSKKAFDKFFLNTSLFRFLYLLFLFFGVNYLFSYIVIPFFLWGIYIFIFKYIKEKKIRKVQHRYIIYLFLISCLISVLLNINSNILGNIFMLCHIAICFFLFYGLYAEKTHESAKREMTFFFKFFMYATTVLMAISIILLLITKTGFKFMGYYFGVMDNRFVGVFTNPNPLAFYAVMAIISCHILYKRNHVNDTLTLRRRITYAVCFFLNLLSLFISDSNAALVFIIIYVCFTAFYKIFRNSDTLRPLNFMLRIVSLILACAVFTLAFLGVRNLTQVGFSALLSSSQTEVKDDSTQYKPSDNKPPVTFKHENKNLDSGRIPLLKQAARLFSMFPIFGVAPQNIVEYGDKYLGGLKYSDFHNGFVTVLVSFGIVGFIFFIIFAVKLAKDMLICIFKKRNKDDKEREMLPCLLAFLAAYCVYSMFDIALLLDISYRVIVFWLIMGYASSYLIHYQKEDTRKLRFASSFFPGIIKRVHSYNEKTNNQENDSNIENTPKEE